MKTIPLHPLAAQPTGDTLPTQPSVAAVADLVLPTRSRVQAQWRLAREATEIAIRLHLADVTLGRVPEREWRHVSLSEREIYLERAAFALMLGDPIKLRVAVVDVAAKMRARLPGEFASFDGAKRVIDLVLVQMMRALGAGRTV